MNNSWLQLLPGTFLWTNDNDGILYNTDSKSSYTFSLSGLIKNWCRLLGNYENLYCIEIKINNEMSDEVSNWLSNIQEMKFGKILSFENCQSKPVSFPPLLYLEKKINKTDQSKNDNLLSYLHEIAFYIGGQETEHPEYYKQLYYPVYSESTLSVKQINKVISHTKGYNLQALYFIGVSCLPPKEVESFIQSIAGFEHKKILIAKLTELGFYVNLIHSNNQCNFQLTVLCHSVAEYENALEKANVLSNVKYILLLTNIEEYIDAEKKDILDSVTLFPVCTGNNDAFFKENIFMTEEEIKQLGLNKREIFRNQTLNSNFFGKLIVMPDGKIYTNPNTNPRGTIHDSIYDIIYTEMTENGSWMETRTESPCNSCIYQWLCPPISNYEYVLGKFNLCFR